MVAILQRAGVACLSAGFNPSSGELFPEPREGEGAPYAPGLPPVTSPTAAERRLQYQRRGDTAVLGEGEGANGGPQGNVQAVGSSVTLPGSPPISETQIEHTPVQATPTPQTPKEPLAPPAGDESEQSGMYDNGIYWKLFGAHCKAHVLSEASSLLQAIRKSVDTCEQGSPGNVQRQEQASLG